MIDARVVAHPRHLAVELLGTPLVVAVEEGDDLGPVRVGGPAAGVRGGDAPGADNADAVRGVEPQQSAMFSYLSPEAAMGGAVDARSRHARTVLARPG